MIPAEGESGEAILGKVEATHNPHETKCAFIYAGVCIRRWESAGSHPNPDGRRIEGQHKHGWDESHGEACVRARRHHVTDTILMSFPVLD